MKIKNLLFLLALLNCCNGITFAQQLPIISNYLQNGIVINPAYTGSVGALSLSLSSRLQWQGVNDAPFTNTLAAHTPLPLPLLSTGLLFSYNKFGFNNTTDIANTYAIRFKIKKVKIALGGSIGFTSVNNALDVTKTNNPSDPTFNENLQNTHLKSGFGIHIEHRNFFVGFSIPSFSLANDNSLSSKNILYNQQYIYGGYLWELSKKFILKPSVYFKHLKGVGFQTDMNLLVSFENRIQGGISLRTTNSLDALIAMINIKINPQLYAGYSYDYLLPGASGISKVSNGSHEIFIRYDFMYLINDINMKKFK